jgi:hypothetical protein
MRTWESAGFRKQQTRVTRTNRNKRTGSPVDTGTNSRSESPIQEQEETTREPKEIRYYRQYESQEWVSTMIDNDRSKSNTTTGVSLQYNNNNQENRNEVRYYRQHYQQQSILVSGGMPTERSTTREQDKD